MSKITGDPFVLDYHESELRIAAEFLTNWLPFLTRDLCQTCTRKLHNRVRSLDPEGSNESEVVKSEDGSSCPTQSCVREEGHENHDEHSDCDTNSLGSWKEGANEWSEARVSSSGATSGVTTGDTSSVRMSWADMAQEDDELEAEEEEELSKQCVDDESSFIKSRREAQKTELSREKREYIRFMNVQRKKDFICLERVHGKLVNILEGLELHTGVFSAAEQKRIVNSVYELQEKGRNGEFRERTYSAPQKWMRGKGRVTIQFGCCYNYATDKNGNPPGILRDEYVDPIPHLFKVIIRRLVGWHVLPPSCVPDSCIVNIYEEGDCIPPHIDNHDFVRPFCTVSFLSECNILFGSNLKIVGPGEFSGAAEIPLPVGSVLVLNGNGADVAKHCVPAVPTKRISITFRKMDKAKIPFGFVPEPDLRGLKPLQYNSDDSKNTNPIKPASPTMSRPQITKQVASEKQNSYGGRGQRSEPRYSGRNQSQPWNRRRVGLSSGT
ncbi:hypothetical protein Scep_000396 [Stephania cephalantha]|uniref:Fe2OG dioxygenase domain-containing protein n=1 Tax=Stephania cephalantha TaxID=152367 RepID=A0AAP0Q2W4_9MAGN